MSGYIGNQPVPQAVEYRYEETATASQTEFSVGGHQVGYIDVYLNGIKLSDADFTDDGSVITLDTGATAGDLFAAVYRTAFEATNVQFADVQNKPTTLSGYGITDAATSAQGSLADSALQNVVEDTTPQLGGDLDLNTHDITGTGDINTTGTATFSGALTASSLAYPTTDGTNGQFLKTDGAGTLSFATVNTDLVSDTTPQLGGDLDLNTHDITGTGGINITGTITGTSFSGDGSALTGVEAFPQGTVMLFVQTAAPTGWTKSTTHNDKALRVVSGTASSGGSSAFTTAFGTPAVTGTVGINGAPAVGNLAVSVSGNIAVGNTTLSINQIPSHAHNHAGVTNGNAFNTGGSNNRGGNVSTGSAGGNGAHNHSASHNLSGTLNGAPGVGNLAGSLSSATTAINVQYVDVIIATKD